MGGPEALEVLAVHTVGVCRWKEVPEDLHCVICDNPFELPCAACDTPGDECPPAFGACGHIFHLHCIAAWLGGRGLRGAAQDTCPMCRQLWRFAAQQQHLSLREDEKGRNLEENDLQIDLNELNPEDLQTDDERAGDEVYVHPSLHA
ncbi:Anaphase promoting complex subunit 11, related [Eimeria tenella]|uniref:Anaphase-promoting complex subunit 11 n=1 Tax=Eimeria tenella TaxID=5802 RepID=U6KKN3_EIMTE|nr:Anaphase promoting complex subunit 11, related [Eimeria tenella]CDJ38479.1 Anaphase promoting complex subunit 11, related [Eimeria tenella]|eukprot:XP_013229317.1 Anaphase promoting complex subunit 11, related [Eimeria tenella]